MADAPSAPEKRRFPRLKESCRLRYKRVETGSLPAEGTEAVSVNVSGGGICFEVEEPIEPGVLLALELVLPDLENGVVSLGRTVWCRPGTEGRHEVGLEFWWIGWEDDGAQRAISEHVRQAIED
jgi:hypothetical protein